MWFNILKGNREKPNIDTHKRKKDEKSKKNTVDVKLKQKIAQQKRRLKENMGKVKQLFNSSEIGWTAELIDESTSMENSEPNEHLEWGSKIWTEGILKYRIKYPPLNTEGGSFGHINIKISSDVYTTYLIFEDQTTINFGKLLSRLSTHGVYWYRTNRGPYARFGVKNESFSTVLNKLQKIMLDNYLDFRESPKGAVGPPLKEKEGDEYVFPENKEFESKIRRHNLPEISPDYLRPSKPKIEDFKEHTRHRKDWQKKPKWKKKLKEGK